LSLNLLDVVSIVYLTQSLTTRCGF